MFADESPAHQAA